MIHTGMGKEGHWSMPTGEELFARLLESMVEDHKAKRSATPQTDSLRRALIKNWSECRGGVKRRRSVSSWRWLVGGHAGRYRYQEDYHLPCDDHVSLWSNATTRIWVSQPYPGRFDPEEMTSFANANGLAFSVSPWPGWHYPGSVLFVEWTAAVKPGSTVYDS